jgi:hypothetical protein
MFMAVQYCKDPDASWPGLDHETGFSVVTATKSRSAFTRSIPVSCDDLRRCQQVFGTW